ncbi:MAG: aminotransferase class V-fold PLP-dependent enzyme [Spirochaetales bacterium]|nr:aminotransferase class V-fold PLP-dependent enzyme [Spirochaetales bacterium]
MSENAIRAYCDAAARYIGNPSSTHPLGINAKSRLEDERAYVASVLGTKPSNIYFTSGGTESDSIVLSSLLNSPSPGEIITTGIEHSAILEWRRPLENAGWTFTALNCPGGYLNPRTLQDSLNERVRMVCFMKVNNVTGTILDTAALVKVIRDYEKTLGRKIHIHCDAVQALGKINFLPEVEDIDSAAFSAHKFCGPRGVGILYNRSKSVLSLSKGGGQEKGLRPGTENLAGICAMTAALKDSMSCMDEKHAEIFGYRCKIEKTALENGYTLISPSSDSYLEFSPYIINICVKPIPSEVFLRVMSDKGFCLSTGSACSSNSRGKAESVLAAMNIDHQRRMSSIRISMGRATTSSEVDLLCKALADTSVELGINRS